MPVVPGFPPTPMFDPSGGPVHNPNPMHMMGPGRSILPGALPSYNNNRGGGRGGPPIPQRRDPRALRSYVDLDAGMAPPSNVVISFQEPEYDKQ